MVLINVELEPGDEVLMNPEQIAYIEQFHEDVHIGCGGRYFALRNSTVAEFIERLRNTKRQSM
jgi:hypothetical protein